MEDQTVLLKTNEFGAIQEDCVFVFHVNFIEIVSAIITHLA